MHYFNQEQILSYFVLEFHRRVVKMLQTKPHVAIHWQPLLPANRHT